MRLLKVLALSLCLAVIPQQKSDAAIGAVVGAVTGNPAIAIAGLVIIGGTNIAIRRSDASFENLMMAMVWMIIGYTTLDGSEVQVVQFKSLPMDTLLEMGLSQSEADAYLDNIDELNLVLGVVSSELTAKSSVEDSIALWELHSDLLDADAYSAAVKLAGKSQR
jgi:hypothetical protein